MGHGVWDMEMWSMGHGDVEYGTWRYVVWDMEMWSMGHGGMVYITNGRVL